MQYADIIVDISHEKLDQTYQYKIPEKMQESAVIGALVEIPFGRGNRKIRGYIIGKSEEPKIDSSFIKPIERVIEDSLAIESQLITLASWIRCHYGATMNEALKTVLPVKRKIKNKEEKVVCLLSSKEEANHLLAEYERKKYTAKVRLLKELIKQKELDYSIVVEQLKISLSTLKSLEKETVITIKRSTKYRNPVSKFSIEQTTIALNKEQTDVVNQFRKEYLSGIRNTYLLYGITGSGKTECYLEMIKTVIEQGKQVIVLIPEIALTYQTVYRFYRQFGERVSVLHSKMSQGERYDQYIRTKNGEIDIMIGPRSALFTPFCNLGLIIIDEEHEGAYKSENPPKYHARETAVKRAELADASVVLGSATPSLEAYSRAMMGEYTLLTLSKRANEHAKLPKVWIVDLREELKQKNSSILSKQLHDLIGIRLQKKEQVMLFINRRGYAGFVSCRSCGHVMKCPHCEVSLTAHNNGKLVCHYCNYEEEKPSVCPSCNSKYIAAFGTGTQKVEEIVKKEFPFARTLRMDFDTTKKKGGHETILSAFANREADILIGTQMIVKGHDFPNVTLVGILAADLSLFANDYRASERTFELLVQASGRAGRGEKEGEVVIQTYNPENYSIITAAKGDYIEFYKREYAYRNIMGYPPAAHLLVVLVTAKEESIVKQSIELLADMVEEVFLESEVKKIGPAKASMVKIKDIYRYVMYLKHSDYAVLEQIKDFLEQYMEYSQQLKKVRVQFDFDPMTSY